jgi:hypothetical protein
MVTFLPYSDFEKSANCLDKKRCWKQVVEAKQIICTLRCDDIPESWENTNSYIFQKWINHPAVQMWKGYEEDIKVYYNVFLKICCNKFRINTELEELTIFYILQKMPWWLNNEDFHRSHRARLIEKDRSFYHHQFPEDEGFNNGKYLWPHNNTQTFKTI